MLFRSIITPNIHEASELSGVVINDDNDIKKAGKILLNFGVKEVIESAKGKISNFKIPRYVVFVDDWPMSSTKVQKFKLKEYDLGKKVFG